MPRHWSRLAAFLAIVLPALVHAQRTDVIRGRVIAADSTPVRDATLTATDTASKIAKQARTDAKGAYEITIENGGGVYTLSVRILGYAPQTRVVARRTDGSMPAADFKLAPVAAQLGAVRSVGERPKTMRSDIGGDFSSAGGVTDFLPIFRSLSGDVTGDLSAAMSILPGITVTPNATGGLPSVSAFGVGADQNGLVLNGMGFGGLLPRDGFSASVVSSTYDPGKGGFAGVQVSLRMQAGANLINRNTHFTFDAPALQWTSPVASRLGTRYGQQIASGSLSGPIVRDKAFYATSYQLSRRASGLTSLLSTDAAALAALRVSPDSIARLLSTLEPIGIPIRTAQVPGSRENTEGRFAMRFDYSPNVPPQQPGNFFFNNVTYDDYYLELGGTVRTNAGAMIGPTAVPSFGGEQSHRDGWAQFTAAKYLPRNVLNETTVSLNGGQDRTTPYLDLPAARILVSSALPDGSLGLSTVQVGGNSSPRSDSRTWMTQLRNVTSWNTWDRRHSVAITLDAAEDGYSTQQGAGFGSFAFNSLSDFTAGRPASYSRTLTSRHTSGTGFAGAFGIGDTYNPTPPGLFPPGVLPPSRPTVQYGVRVEGNRYGITPAYNPTIESLFGVRTDFVPSDVRVMPMVGFNWPVLGELKAPQGFSFGRKGRLSGGIREYRGTLSTRGIDSYLRQTGLPDAIQQLFCVGAATPVPDWRAYDQSDLTIPTQCANGLTSTPLAQLTPPVALFAPDYTTFESWRPNLSFSYGFSVRFRVTLNGTYALNRHTPGIYDLNFDGVPRFSLASEGNRPVYVSPTSIVPGTGAEAWTESRRSPLFAHVAESRSDLRGETRTIGASVNFVPFFFGDSRTTFVQSTLGYNYNDAREQVRGFSGTTAGDPALVSWSRGSMAAHVVTMQVSVSNQRWGNIALQGRAQSGTPFTPIVAGDVNGDGYVNDRAFVFGPAAAGDTAAAGAMSRLLATAPPNARRCLQRQLGAIAGRNSCTGAWSMPLLNLSISPDPYRFKLGNRGNIQLLVTNILSGLDQALHGSDKLHGWGQFSFSDPTLLTVRGFDPAANRFVYTVNPLFGSSSQFRQTFRAPFMLTLDVRLEVGPDRETQFLSGLLRPSPKESGELTEQQIKSRIARGFNPIDQLLMVKDSLKLTQAQVDTIKAIAQANAVRRDSIATAMARYLVSRHGDYSGEDVRQHWHTAGVASYLSFLGGMKKAMAVLTPEQRERSTKVVQLQGLTQIQDIKESDVPRMFRYPMSGLP